MMARAGGREHSNAGERGMGLIELMIAMVVLAVGLLGVAALIATAVGTNSRNKLDTGATMMAQATLERLTSTSAAQDLPLTITDCNRTGPVTWPMTTLGVTTQQGSGASLDVNDGDRDGDMGEIDFGANTYANLAAAGYAMRFTACGGAGAEPVYEVRWNVRRLNAHTKLFTVGVRQMTWGNAQTAGRRFIPPVSLRTIAGN